MEYKSKYMIYVQQTKNCVNLLKWVIANMDTIKSNGIGIDSRLVTSGDLKLLREFGVNGLPVAYRYSPSIDVNPIIGVDNIKNSLIRKQPKKKSRLEGVSLYGDSDLDDMYKNEFFDQRTGKPISTADEDTENCEDNLNINNMMSTYNKRLAAYNPTGPKKPKKNPQQVNREPDNVHQAEYDFDRDAEDYDDIGGFEDTRNTAHQMGDVKQAVKMSNDGSIDDDILQALIDKIGD